MIRIDWTQVYWWLLFGGLGLTIIYLLVGDVLEGIFGGIEGIFNPTLALSALAIVGGAGVLLSKYTNLSNLTVLGASVLIGIIAYILVYYFLIVPITRADTSTTYSIQELVGNLAEVITSIPNSGYGEIIVTTISGIVNFTAKSMDGNMIPNGSRVVVVKAEQDHLVVTMFEDMES